MPPPRVFGVGKKIGSGGFVGSLSFQIMTLAFGLLVWPAESRFRGHGHLHRHRLRNKEVEGILDVEAHALEI